MAAAQQGLLDFRYPQLVNLDKEIASTQFDVDKFNKSFSEKKIDAQQQNREIEKLRLQKMNEPIDVKNPYDLSFAEMLIGIKDTWFGITDDLFQQKFYTETFTKNNRLFFIGLTFIIIVIIIFLYDLIFDSTNLPQHGGTNKIIEIHHYGDSANCRCHDLCNSNIPNSYIPYQYFNTNANAINENIKDYANLNIKDYENQNIMDYNDLPSYKGYRNNITENLQYKFDIANKY